MDFSDKMGCLLRGGSMKRRGFMGLLGGAAVSPLAARAQQRATQQRIAIFHPAIPTTLR